MISLLILGVIASLTIPSLIQNTHKKEEVVKVKKALSILNQAISLNYANTDKKLSDYGDEEAIVDMLKKNMNVVNSGNYTIITQDGLLYHSMGYGQAGAGSNITFWICTNCNKYASTNLNETDMGMALQYGHDPSGENYTSTLGHLTGLYTIYCNDNGCVPDSDTAAIINSTDPTKAEE